jgi:hypothetical protein
MYVHNAVVVLKTPSDTIKELDAEVRQQTGIHFRRVNRFILMAIYGAHLCADGRDLDKATAIWLTTENGTVGDTEKGLGQLFGQGIYPKPYNFINTMTNTAAFYIAQSLGLDSPNITLSCKEFAFERGLSLAGADLKQQTVSGFLVGGVDEAVFSEKNLKSRFGNNLRDGSVWLYISNEKNRAIGVINEIRYFSSENRAAEWLTAIDLPENVILAFGVRVSAEEQLTWQGRIPQAKHYDHIALHGYFDSAPAACIGLFFSEFKNRTCLHINRDSRGHYMVVVAEVF